MKKHLKKSLSLFIIPFLIGVNSCKSAEKEITLQEAHEIYNAIYDYHVENYEKIKKMSNTTTANSVIIDGNIVTEKRIKVKYRNGSLHYNSYVSVTNEPTIKNKYYLYKENDTCYKNNEVDPNMEYSMIIGAFETQMINLNYLTTLKSQIQSVYNSKASYKFYSSGEGNLTFHKELHEENINSTITYTYKNFLLSSYETFYEFSEIGADNYEKQETTTTIKYNTFFINPYK